MLGCSQDARSTYSSFGLHRPPGAQDSTTDEDRLFLTERRGGLEAPPPTTETPLLPYSRLTPDFAMLVITGAGTCLALVAALSKTQPRTSRSSAQ